MAAKPRPTDTQPKTRRRKRKARTEDTQPAALEAAKKKRKKTEKATPQHRPHQEHKRGQKHLQTHKSVSNTTPDPKSHDGQRHLTSPPEPDLSSFPVATSPSPSPQPQQPRQQSETFPSFYLRRVTAELADDLDKVRQAGDFRARTSLPMLIHALQQGEAIFSAEERGGFGGGEVGLGVM
ncbi:hypothetical protein H2199_002026 [Coniosporium tulheliwenetii]|uniref:Uncharacterized protein n=1 Tax=Coniosporium tulheliwenetii TaxID=3383036 RepID=A0ACC2ZGT7_9PEZI|nr:hypothetical protein H2199_002026 [Cladosporium sp. JES 115]